MSGAKFCHLILHLRLLTRGPSLNLELHPQESFYFHPIPYLGSGVHMVCQDFYMGVGDLNSCLHTRAASIPTH